jgi:hypothetical protein
MNPFEMVATIVLIVMIASVLKARYRCQSGDDGPREDATARAETQALMTEVRALKQRIATLERIATDGSSALDREIEALRDRP